VRRFIILLLVNFLFTFKLFGEIGYASWYGPDFHGKLTANGERFNTNDLTAAHKTLPFNSIIKVTSLTNNLSVVVRINDRGPFVKNRVIDLSMAAAKEIDMIKTGTDEVKLEILEKGVNRYHRYHSNLYSIQIASFSDRLNADGLVKKLREQGIKSRINSVFQPRSVHRVIIDNLSYSQMQLLRVRLATLGIKNPLIIKH